MGSLGDKFKKLAGDQTRQLLQNFQNAQSSKTRNGYSYGKLNEDGTATLADGTVVQTVVKGRPGQYAPVFNLGNGQGLVDQPEAKFFSIDNAGSFNAWQMLPIVEAIRTLDTPNSDFFNFNVFSTTAIKLRNAITGDEYYLDSDLLDLLPDYPVPIFTGYRGPVENGVFRAEELSYSSGYFGVLRDSELRPPSENRDFIYTYGVDWFTDVYDESNFCYGSKQALFSIDGRDILLFRVSNVDLYAYEVVLGSTIQDWDAGEISLTYVILKDWYIDNDTIKSNSPISGKYIIPDNSASLPTYNYPGLGPGGFSSANFRYLREFQLALSRDTNNEPLLSGLYRYDQQTALTTGLDGVRADVSQYGLVTNINTSPTVVWSILVDYYDPNREFVYPTLPFCQYSDKIYSMFSRYTQINFFPSTITSQTDYKLNYITGIPETPIIGGDGISFDSYSSALLISNTRVWLTGDVKAALERGGFPELRTFRGFSLDDYLGCGRFCIRSPWATGTYGGYSCYNYSQNSWVLLYTQGLAPDPEVDTFAVKIVEGEDGLRCFKIKNEFDYLSFYNFTLTSNPTTAQKDGITYTGYRLGGIATMFFSR